MTCYNDIAEWEAQWKRRISHSDFVESYRGAICDDEDGWWVAVTDEVDRHGGRCQIFGTGETPEYAIQDWWENRLNAMAPEEVYNSVMAIKAGIPQSFPEDE